MALRVAFVGKGGAGKSSIAGMFARYLAREGNKVLALDSDPLPGLSFSLGLQALDLPIPDEAVEEQPEGSDGPRFKLREGLSALKAVDLYSSVAPDGVRYLQFGKLGRNTKSLGRSQAAFLQILAELPREPWSLVGDLPGGTRQAFFGWARFADLLLIVVEPTSKSILSARRLMRLAQDKEGPAQMLAIANKVRHKADVELVRVGTGLDVAAEIPWDSLWNEADRRGIAPMDFSADSPGVEAVICLAQAMSVAPQGALP